MRRTNHTKSRESVRREALETMREVRRGIDPALLDKAREAITGSAPEAEGYTIDKQKTAETVRLYLEIKGYTRQ